MHRLRNDHKGFTLIELMIVIGIIGVLAGISIPALHTANVKTRRVACKKNMANINYRIDIYNIEHDSPPMDWKNDLKIYFAHEIPDCPGSGTYVVERPSPDGTGIGEISCTYHGFYYDEGEDRE